MIINNTQAANSGIGTTGTGTGGTGGTGGTDGHQRHYRYERHGHERLRRGQQYHPRRHRLPDAHAGAAQESGSDEPGRQQHRSWRNSPRSAKCRASRSSIPRSVRCRIRSCPVKRCKPRRSSDIRRWSPSPTATLTSAGGTLSGAVSVPQTSSQVVLNITNSAGVLVQIAQPRRAAGGTREFFMERANVERLAGAGRAPTP